jgi:hypothetical protein
MEKMITIVKQERTVTPICMKEHSLSEHPFIGTIECSDCSSLTDEDIKITLRGEFKCSECLAKDDECEQEKHEEFTVR